MREAESRETGTEVRHGDAVRTADGAPIERSGGDGPAEQEPILAGPVEGRPEATTGASNRDPSAPLFSDRERQELRSRWEEIQAGFVDQPRKAVEAADRLVADTTDRLTEIFAEVRGDLESEWTRGEEISTEDLRLALRQYRSFFGKLLGA